MKHEDSLFQSSLESSRWSFAENRTPDASTWGAVHLTAGQPDQKADQMLSLP